MVNTATTTKKKPVQKKKKKPKSGEPKAAPSKAEDMAKEYYSPGSLGRMDAPEDVQQITLPGMVTPISTTMEGGAQSIAQSEDLYNKRLQKDQHIEEALKRSLSATEGLTAPENQALKAKAYRDIQSNAATTDRAMRQAMGESGMSGWAANNALRQSKSETNRQLAGASTDLAVANLAAKQSALSNYGSLAQGAYSTYAGAQDSALGRLMDARKDVAGYTLDAQKANQAAEGTNISNRLTTDTANANIQRGNVDSPNRTANSISVRARRRRPDILEHCLASRGSKRRRRIRSFRTGSRGSTSSSLRVKVAGQVAQGAVAAMVVPDRKTTQRRRPNHGLVARRTRIYGHWRPATGGSVLPFKPHAIDGASYVVRSGL